MRMDTAIVGGDFPGTLALLKTTRDRGWTMISNRVQRAANMLESCEDEGLKQSFLVSCSEISQKECWIISCLFLGPQAEWISDFHINFTYLGKKVIEKVCLKIISRCKLIE